MNLTQTRDNTGSLRRSLVDRLKDVKVRDPAAQARLQVSELDKTAQHSAMKRKQCNDSIEQDLKEISHINHQIAMIKEKYDPLCEHIMEAKTRKEHLMKTLQECLEQEKMIMGSIKTMTHDRIMSDFKLNKETATRELEAARGYGIGVNTTYHQKRRNPT